jgi:hypothetical protein
VMKVVVLWAVVILLGLAWWVRRSANKKAR